MTPAQEAVKKLQEQAPLSQRDKTILGVAGITAGVAVLTVFALARAVFARS